MDNKKYSYRHRTISGVEQKSCLDCQQWFDITLENFRKDKKSTDGFNTRCGSCQTKKDHKHYMEILFTIKKE